VKSGGIDPKLKDRWQITLTQIYLVQEVVNKAISTNRKIPDAAMGRCVNTIIQVDAELRDVAATVVGTITQVDAELRGIAASGAGV